MAIIVINNATSFIKKKNDNDIEILCEDGMFINFITCFINE